MKKWSDKTTLEKVADIILILALVAWVIFEILEHKTKFPYAATGGYLCLCVMCIAEAFSCWNTRRKFSYVWLVGAAFMIAVLVLVKCLR